MSTGRTDLIDAVTALIAFRRDNALPAARFAHGRDEGDDTDTSVRWLHPAGRNMSDDDWQDNSLSVFGMERQRRDGPHLLTCLNTGDDGQFALPDGDWTHRIDTTADPVTCEKAVTGVIDLPGQSVQVFLAVSS